MATPRFERPKRGQKWPPAVKALVIFLGEEAGNMERLVALLEERARWPQGLPTSKTLKTWTNEAGLNLVTADPSKSARTAEARQARFARLEEHRSNLSEQIGARILPKAAALIIARLEEQTEVEERVAKARLRLDEALTMQNAADGMGDEAVRSARRQTIMARLLLEIEQDGRIPYRDLVRTVQVGVAQHLGLEGLTDEEDDETNPLIVEIRIPRPTPDAIEAKAIPQHELPERTD